jgi:hypothetical protein
MEAARGNLASPHYNGISPAGEPSTVYYSGENG